MSADGKDANYLVDATGVEALMFARQGVMTSELFGDDIKKLFPIVEPHCSDSGTFDNVLEFLLMSGRTLQEAVMMMRKLGGDGAETLLLQALEDPDSGVRWRACHSLAAMRAQAAIPALEALQEKDEDPMVRKHAEKAVHKIKSYPKR